MRLNRSSLLLSSAAMLTFTNVSGAADLGCFAQASARYRVPEALLRAISRVESRDNPAAIHVNKNGTTDIGHMQINSVWLPTLARYGIDQSRLSDPCINTNVGAWILANNFRRIGYQWKAVGAYNAISPVKAAIYTKKIADSLSIETKRNAN
ncbi:MAG: Lytic transglycosylase catalytic [Candidatus Gallionella acididurans]|uniref:Lytic transglycosylase catalytic n=1 Tax=Candidatus Gallionella acididurans TaxID=1796491 RepID=A0A139BN65_9PROT|nr:MAG: Lytic transglycosylase catalytic [Candidatus Gallionella acididurans]